MQVTMKRSSWPEANTLVSVFLLELDGILRRDFCLEADTKLSCLLRCVGENIQNSPEMLASVTSGRKHIWTTSHSCYIQTEIYILRT